MTGMPRAVASALPAVAKQEGETRAVLIATGQWVPRSHNVAPKVPRGGCALPACALEIVSEPLGKWAGVEVTGNCNSQGYRSLLVMRGMPICLSQADSASRLSVCVLSRYAEDV